MALTGSKELLPVMEKEDRIGRDVHNDYAVFRMFGANRKIGPVIRVAREGYPHADQ